MSQRHPCSRREALPARAGHRRVWVLHLEAALLKVVAVVQLRAAHEQGALRVDHHAHIARDDHDVTVCRAIHQVQLVLQAGAAAAYHGHAQGTVFRAALACQQARQLRGGVGQHLDELVVANLVVDILYAAIDPRVRLS